MNDKLELTKFTEQKDGSFIAWSQDKIDKIPAVVTSFEYLDDNFFDGVNDVKTLLFNFRGYLDISKRVNSENTKSAYLWNCKQFLVWCNAVKFNIEDVKETLLLRNIVILYNKALEKSDLSRNSIALKMNSIRKFFEWRDFTDLKLNIRQAFNPDWVTTQDTNAFKRQVRINKEVFDAIKDVVAADISEHWIFYLLAHGCRRSEIAVAKNEDVDFLNKCVNIYQPKTGDIKKIPMPDWIISKSQIETGYTYLVTNESRRTAKMKGQKPVTSQYIYQIIKRWVAKTDYSDVRVTPHSFRRYFINMLQKKGASDTNIAKLSGHKTLQMISKYGFDLDTESNPIVTGKMIDY